MNRARIVFVLIIMVALVVVGAGLLGQAVKHLSQGGETRPPGTPLPADAVVVEISSSNTKEDWMDQVIATFNEEGHMVGDRPIVVTVEHVGSGSSMNEILDGQSQPVVWSPGSDLWVTSINQAWRDRTGRPLTDESCPATLRLPLAIAMWRPMAEALGWPEAPIGWDDLADLSTNPEGWAAHGHPEWGEFKFGHPHPEHSNSGMLSLVAEVYSAAGLTAGLDVEKVKSQQVMDSVGAVEQRVFHYGKKDTDILGRMTQRGPEYLHAVTSYEANVIKWNRDHAGELRFPFAAIYPDDGTFWVENPYCVLDGDWVSDEQAEAAEIFRDYLLSPEQQALAIDWGLRPADPSVPLHAPIDQEHGAVPSITMDQVPHLAYPSDEVVGHILDVWHQVKKKATVVLLIDTSGSMQEDNKIRGAVQGALTFLDQMDPQDRVYVVTFASEVIELPAHGPVGEVGEHLSSSLSGLYAEGATVLHEAMIYAVNRIQALQAEDEREDEPRLYGIVLLSDGKNETVGGPTENDMLSRLPSGTEASGVKIYTIAYGDDADLDLLRTLANRTNGKQFSGDVENIEAVYFLISSEF
jgi:Ca-activated chloride channel family protein